MREQQVAARRDPLLVPPDDAAGVLFIQDVMDDRVEDQAGRPGLARVRLARAIRWAMAGCDVR